MNGTNDLFKILGADIFILLSLAVITFGIAFGYRHHNVWSMKIQGEAELMRATQTKQILIEQARAEKEATIEIIYVPTEAAIPILEAGKR